MRCPTMISSSRMLGVAALLIAYSRALRVRLDSRRLLMAFARRIIRASLHLLLDLELFDFEVYYFNGTPGGLFQRSGFASVFADRSRAIEPDALRWTSERAATLFRRRASEEGEDQG